MWQLQVTRVCQLEKKQKIECDLVKKSAIYKEEEIKGKVMVSCLR
jgi:hypothetical protein